MPTKNYLMKKIQEANLSIEIQPTQLSIFNEENKYTENLSLKDKFYKILSGNLDFHSEFSGYASHNFHSFPAKFPPQLPRIFIEELTQNGDRVLDPMNGSGTTVLEAILHDRIGIGFDIDPLAILISKIKTTTFDEKELRKQLYYLIERVRESLKTEKKQILAELQDYERETKDFIDYWFLPETQIELQALIREINKIPDLEHKQFFKVAFSGIIIKKSGSVSMALDLAHTRPHLAKIVKNEQGEVIFGKNLKDNPTGFSVKTQRSPIEEFEKKSLSNIKSIFKSMGKKIPAFVSFGNAQQLPLQDNSVDLIVTSPPYASNAIDYMRAHKFSLVWFGYPIGKLSEKRRTYIGSDYVTDYEFLDLPFLPRKIISELQKVNSKKSQALYRYYVEIQTAIREMYRVLRPGKPAVIVVGNSILSGVDAQVAECLTEIGQNAGLELVRINIRQLDRNKRMLPAGNKINLESQIQQRMHEEYVIGFLKPED